MCILSGDKYISSYITLEPGLIEHQASIFSNETNMKPFAPVCHSLTGIIGRMLKVAQCLYVLKLNSVSA